MTDVILPYSVKQGELMVVTAITNNFLKRCMMVKATLYESADFQVELCEDCQYTACLCADPSHAFTWNVRPLQLGSINITVGIKALDTTDQCDGQQPIVPEKGASDMVQRRVLVEAHGIPVEKTQSLLLCAFDSTTVPLDLPEDIVLGSQKAEVSVTGDIMGKALDNLNNLVRMPTGCGEQNMIYLAPMVAGIEYLGTTAQLTDEIMEKARSYMETGYQNLLNFKHPDGSYSAWATDASGSTWLTALVVFNLVKCERYIYVDDKHVVDGLAWLASLQQEDGCFQNVGFLYHTDLQGGQDSSTSLTAYVLQAFLEKGDPQYDDVINKAKICLEKCLEPETSTYAKALCAHTFTLTGDTDQRQQLLEQLDTVAIKTDNEKYWTNGAVPPDPQATPVTSIEVEISARCLLAYTSQQTPSQEDLGAAVPIVNWLTKHQTASGGWFSTQDTVVGLQALSAYGSHTFTPGVTPVITITDDQGFNETVEVDPGKLTEVQKRGLSHIPSTCTLEASRGGCAYIQVALWYNTEEAEADSLFSLTVDTAAVHCPPDPVPSFTISFTTSYNNENKPSNMALVMFKMVSGFVPVRESVNKLLEMEEVKKVESSPSQVTIYFNEIGSSPISGSFQVEQSSKVLDVQPAQVTVMDYYQTDQRKELSYTAPCS
ncbi:alpha-2-macroglobulin-like protein 1 [Hyperolius riggenbachi]|uniref:alpha-2-macroglobulin-like protein 1 n=1 Tax=Hyperolius riggenbachi TaxID=752182 RepID=UPI0035A37845